MPTPLEGAEDLVGADAVREERAEDLALIPQKKSKSTTARSVRKDSIARSTPSS
ncbi:MAG: hypothetical protein R3B82_11035 [Sandaracinaceae bacterium]